MAPVSTTPKEQGRAEQGRSGQAGQGRAGQGRASHVHIRTITWNVNAFMPSSPFMLLAFAHSAHALSANSTVRGIYFVATFGLKAGTRILRS